MKKFLSFLLLFLLVFSAFVPATFAQDTTSTGCTSTVGTITTFPTTITDDYFTDEEVTFAFVGAGLFTVNVNGNPEVVDAVDGDTFTYIVPADGNYAFEIVNTTSDPTSSVDTSCVGADDVEPDFPPGMICHIPPGNPENAHTITVGEPAVDAHLAHGDTLGPCPEGTDTKIENPDIGAVIFIEPLNGIVKVYSDCGEDSCAEETIIELLEQVDFSLVLDEEGNFIAVEESVQFGEIAELGPSVVIYYLHPDPDNPALGVFQVNIYFDSVLVDDSTLLFVDAEGIIVDWTDHSVWDEDGDEDD